MERYTSLFEVDQKISEIKKAFEKNKNIPGFEFENVEVKQSLSGHLVTLKGYSSNWVSRGMSQDKRSVMNKILKPLKKYGDRILGVQYDFLGEQNKTYEIFLRI